MRRIGEFGEGISIDRTHPSPVGELPKIGEGTFKVARHPGRPVITPSDPIGVDRDVIGESLRSNSGKTTYSFKIPAIDKPNL